MHKRGNRDILSIAEDEIVATSESRFVFLFLFFLFQRKVIKNIRKKENNKKKGEKHIYKKKKENRFLF